GRRARPAPERRPGTAAMRRRLGSYLRCTCQSSFFVIGAARCGPCLGVSHWCSAISSIADEKSHFTAREVTALIGPPPRAGRAIHQSEFMGLADAIRIGQVELLHPDRP